MILITNAMGSCERGTLRTLLVKDLGKRSPLRFIRRRL